jgi:hypothetical protein
MLSDSFSLFLFSRPCCAIYVNILRLTSRDQKKQMIEDKHRLVNADSVTKLQYAIRKNDKKLKQHLRRIQGAETVERNNKTVSQ